MTKNKNKKHPGEITQKDWDKITKILPDAAIIITARVEGDELIKNVLISTEFDKLATVGLLESTKFELLSSTQ